jgi:hypothetical protein
VGRNEILRRACCCVSAISVNDRKSPKLAVASTLQMTRRKCPATSACAEAHGTVRPALLAIAAIAENRPVRMDAGSHPSKHSRE